MSDCRFLHEVSEKTISSHASRAVTVASLPPNLPARAPSTGTMADAVSTSRFAITAIAPRARVRRARRLAAAATTGRPVSRRAAAAESS